MLTISKDSDDFTTLWNDFSSIEDCPSGQKNWYRVPAFTTLDGSEHSIQIQVCKGSEGGPTIFVAAGTHGNELMGVEICRQLAIDLSPEKIKGMVIVAPILNPSAFRQRTRFNPIDGKDPSQLYPGDKSGSATEQLVHNIWSKLASKAECVIDIHSAGFGSKNIPHIYVPWGKVSRCEFSSMELADIFGCEAAIQTRPDEDYHFRFDRALASCASQFGASAFAPELGEGGITDEFHVQYGLTGVRNVMKKLGLIKGSIQPQGKRKVVTRTAVVRSKISGILWRSYELGEELSEGRKIADVYGIDSGKATLASPISGIVLWTTLFGNTNAGDDVCWIGY